MIYDDSVYSLSVFSRRNISQVLCFKNRNCAHSVRDIYGAPKISRYSPLLTKSILIEIVLNSNSLIGSDGECVKSPMALNERAISFVLTFKKKFFKPLI